MTDQGLILVTGATGFVGKWTVIQLLQAGYPVRGTIRSMSRPTKSGLVSLTQTGEARLAKLELVEADLLDDRAGLRRCRASPP